MDDCTPYNELHSSKTAFSTFPINMPSQVMDPAGCRNGLFLVSGEGLRLPPTDSGSQLGKLLFPPVFGFLGSFHIVGQLLQAAEKEVCL